MRILLFYVLFCKKVQKLPKETRKDYLENEDLVVVTHDEIKKATLSPESFTEYLVDTKFGGVPFRMFMGNTLTYFAVHGY